METLKNMNQSDNTILKEPKRRKITDNILVLYLLATLLILLGQTAGMLLGFLPFMTGSDAAITVYMYISFIGLWAVALLYMRFTKKNRPILLAIGSRASGNNVRNLLIGFIIGFGLNSICILAAWLHGDITLYYDSFQPLSFVRICLRPIFGRGTHLQGIFIPKITAELSQPRRCDHWKFLAVRHPAPWK